MIIIFGAIFATPLLTEILNSQKHEISVLTYFIKRISKCKKKKARKNLPKQLLAAL